MDYDLTQPELTVVDKSMKGKTFFFYGTNRTGKTDVAVKFPKTFAIPFENGLNAIAGMPFAKPKKWSDTRKITKQLKRPEVKELYETVLIDTADKMGEMVTKYICSIHGVTALKDVEMGQGYLDITKYIGEFLDAITDEGYTVVIIGHDSEKTVTDPQTGAEYTRIMPNGNKRVVGAVCDLVDVIGYCEPNGFDADGKEILSTVYLKDAKFFKAGSRWKHIVPSVTPFTVEGVTLAVVEAIEKEEKLAGGKGFVDKVNHAPAPEVVSFENLLANCKAVAIKIKKITGDHSFFKELVDKLFNTDGMKLTQATKAQREIVEDVYDGLQNKLNQLEKGQVDLPT